jgi:hypothetical protein
MLLFVGVLAACEAKDNVNTGRATDTSDSSNTDAGTHSDAPGTGSHHPTDEDTGTGGNQGSDGPIEPTCTCDGTGANLDAMVCAVDLCDPATVISTSYASPSKAETNGTYAAVPRFGNVSNDLEPLYGASYALMATGPATGTAHSQDMGGIKIDDPFAKGAFKVDDVMEWTLRLKAPKNAYGFQIHYVFFSMEYDEYIGSQYNDKFYIFLEAPSTNGGKRTVVNFTSCRNPNQYSDFVCDSSKMACEDGQKYCYIAINTALSECCWYGGCLGGKASTDISGTGFECGTKATDTRPDPLLGIDGTGDQYGSSTGWLVTEWPVEPEEEFNIIFHVHDTSDHVWDSEVMIDKFLFVGKAEAGTKPI